MSTHWIFGLTATPGAGRLRSALSNLEDALNKLQNEFDTMTFALNGDGSQDAHYSDVVSEYAFANVTTAHQGYATINTGLSKVNTDASVSNTKTALNQMFDQLR